MLMWTAGCSTVRFDSLLVVSDNRRIMYVVCALSSHQYHHLSKNYLGGSKLTGPTFFSIRSGSRNRVRWGCSGGQGDPAPPPSPANTHPLLSDAKLTIRGEKSAACYYSTDMIYTGSPPPLLLLKLLIRLCGACPG